MHKYIVTDPCYIIDEKKWDTLPFNYLREKKYAEFDEAVKNLIGGYNTKVSDTGYGDWSNAMIVEREGICSIDEDRFCADSGMVCFVEINDETDSNTKLMDFVDNGFVCRAIIESTEPLYCEFDKGDPNWIVLKIYNQRNVLVAHSCYNIDF